MIKCRFWHLLKKGKCLKFKIMVFCIRTEKNPSITRFQNLFFIFPFLLPITLSNILENAYILSIFGVGNSRWNEKCSEKWRHLYGTVFWQKDRMFPREPVLPSPSSYHHSAASVSGSPASARCFSYGQPASIPWKPQTQQMSRDAALVILLRCNPCLTGYSLPT